MTLLSARPDLFRRQGSVTATWRKTQRRTYGPYYRLSYRDEGRQHSVYLGRVAAGVEHVRRALADLQRPRRQRQAISRLQRRGRSALRRDKRKLDLQLRPLGLRLQGFEVRGWRTSALRPLVRPPKSRGSGTPCLTTDASLRHGVPDLRVTLPSLPGIPRIAGVRWSRRSFPKRRNRRGPRDARCANPFPSDFLPKAMSPDLAAARLLLSLHGRGQAAGGSAGIIARLMTFGY